ncbi:urease accessory protein UreD [Bifidobacterium oedipodis]|uniref:Urease accessory protein UreD n=1 Tax=Bifidobacterium oedipodis TaxID=2675322 RepID=A0A7Y0HU49_9BIFI|nr:urease accessory protein UreD [Bifidobacterium sp. DSM 109957]NMM94787.1 urease accessory protein [Bifidobacterium sp. DSM 109957]
MHSEFRLTTAFRHGRTKIDDIYFSAPFKLMHPFVNGRHAEYMISFVGPGFLAGDTARMNITFAPGTDSTISTQSYEKVLDTKDGSASRTIDLTVQGDAKAVFLPFPVIPFRNSAFSTATTAHISPESTFVYADVVTNGRAGMGEQWLMRRFESSLRVYVDEQADETDHHRRGRPRKHPEEPISHLAFADHTLLDPSRYDYTHMAMWRGYTHCGLMYIHLPEHPADHTGGNDDGISNGTSSEHSASAASARTVGGNTNARRSAEEAIIARIRQFAEESNFPGEFGATRAMNGIVVRILTKRGDDAYDFITKLTALLTNHD